jgi:Tfp pilus assembly protein PilF
MAVASGQGALIWLAKEGRHLSTDGWQSDVRSCDVSPDGCWVATGSFGLREGPGAKVWESTSGKLAAEFPSGPFCPVLFSPDGKWLVTGGGRFHIWQVGSWQEGPSLGGEPGDQACAFSDDGRLLALGGSPGTVRLLEPATGRELARLTAPVQTRLWPKCFTPGGGKLVVVGTDTRTLHVFHLSLIRSQLRELDLDWDAALPGSSPIQGPEAKLPKPLAVRVQGGDSQVDAQQYQRARKLAQQGLHHLEAKELPNAIKRWREAVQVDPEYAEVQNNLAWFLSTGPESIRKPKEALEHARRAVELAPWAWAYYNTLGVALYRNARYADAVPALKKSLEQDKGRADAYDLYFLAMCRHMLGDPVAAREYLNLANQWFERHRSELSAFSVEELSAFKFEAESVLRNRPETDN